MDEVRYQVFVSSTFIDLKEEREKVLQAILQLRSFPAGMELFPAADEDQFEFIKREIDSSDYYIVIVGGRYGSLDKAGVSYTEKEYDYARSKGKPILAFIVKDTGKLIGEKLETSDELRAKLTSFRIKAQDSKLVRFYSNPDELKSEVLHSLPAQFNLKPMKGWVRNGQHSRESLEELASLQREVLKLRAENERLLALSQQPENLLASGSTVVGWTLNFNEFVFDGQWPTIREYYFQTTWDGLLQILFSAGSSQATMDEVTRRFAKAIVESCPPEVATEIWKVAARRVLETYYTLPMMSSLSQALGEIVRQFNGLGLINEAKETVYVKVPHSDRSTAVTSDIWRLTQKGQLRLALRGAEANGAFLTSDLK